MDRASAIRLDSDDGCRGTRGEPKTASGPARSKEKKKKKRQENRAVLQDAIAGYVVCGIKS